VTNYRFPLIIQLPSVRFPQQTQLSLRPRDILFSFLLLFFSDRSWFNLSTAGVVWFLFSFPLSRVTCSVPPPPSEMVGVLDSRRFFPFCHVCGLPPFLSRPPAFSFPLLPSLKDLPVFFPRRAPSQSLALDLSPATRFYFGLFPLVKVGLFPLLRAGPLDLRSFF